MSWSGSRWLRAALSRGSHTLSLPRPPRPHLLRCPCDPHYCLDNPRLHPCVQQMARCLLFPSRAPGLPLKGRMTHTYPPVWRQWNWDIRQPRYRATQRACQSWMSKVIPDFGAIYFLPSSLVPWSSCPETQWLLCLKKLVQQLLAAATFSTGFP